MESTGLRDPNAPTQVKPEPSPQESQCPAPTNFRSELDRYDRNVRLETWKSPRYRMTYRVLGEGPLVVLAPGIASTYRVYALLLNKLSERFRTVVYDYPGEHPEDGARLRRINHDDLASDFLGLIDEISSHNGPVFPVGLSFGSTVVLKALGRRPGQYPKAALQGAFPRRTLTAAERLAFAIGRRIPGTVGSLPFRRKVLRYNFQSHFPRLIADRWDFYLEQNALTPIRSLNHRLSLLKGLDLRPMLGRITSEVLLMRGNEDRVISRQAQDELLAGIPSARGVMMPNVGHQPFLTHAEAMAEVIGQWFVPGEQSHCSGDGREAGCGGDPALCRGDGGGSCGRERSTSS